MNPHREKVPVDETDYFMPYEPVVRVRSGGDLLFISGATALPLYHQHPHEHDKLDPPEDVRGDYFKGDFPASTWVEVRRLVDPRLRLEMNAIAVIPVNS